MQTANKIIEYIRGNGRATPHVLALDLGLSRQVIHRHLDRLVAAGRVSKIGQPPRVFYAISDVVVETSVTPSVSPPLRRLIEANFLNITPAGERLEGVAGFVAWCQEHQLPVEKTALEYQRTLKKYQRYHRTGLIDGMHKLKTTFPQVYLDRLFYLDFYSIERFGKTKLGQLLLYAKQSQDRKLITELVAVVRPRIRALISKFKIDAVAFVPPTVRRELQLMRELERQLRLPLPVVKIVKVKTSVAVAQKTLTKLVGRIENAHKTFVVTETKRYQRVLLIDDALGSGATENAIAQKIKDQSISRVVIGLAITGSFSGFEVISEV